MIHNHAMFLFLLCKQRVFAMETKMAHVSDVYCKQDAQVTRFLKNDALLSYRMQKKKER